MIDAEWREVYATVVAAVASLITFFLQYWSDTTNKREKILATIVIAIICLLLVFIPDAKKNEIEADDSRKTENGISLGDASVSIPEKWKYIQKSHNTWILTNDEELEGSEIYLSYNTEKLLEHLIDCTSTEVPENTKISEDFFIKVSDANLNDKVYGAEYEVMEVGTVEKHCYSVEFKRNGDKYRVYGKSKSEYQMETKSAIQDIKFTFNSE